jgi:hypothetical protein
VRRFALPALVSVIGLLLLADLLVVNDTLAAVAGVAVDVLILIGAGAALAAGASLLLRRGRDLVARRGDPVGAAAVLIGFGVVVVAGLRPGSAGAGDPALGWIVAALMIPIGATLFAILFTSTLGAMRRAVLSRDPRATVMVISATAVVALLVPLGGSVGAGLADAAAWLLSGPIGAVLRGVLIGVAILAAVVAARTMLGIGASDD